MELTIVLRCQKKSESDENHPETSQTLCEKSEKMLQLQLSLLARLSLRLALLYLPRRGPVAPRRPRPSPEATLSH